MLLLLECKKEEMRTYLRTVVVEVYVAVTKKLRAGIKKKKKRAEKEEDGESGESELVGRGSSVEPQREV